jgi:hypothetical protein
VQGQPESQKPKEQYGTSYLAMEAAHQKPLTAKKMRRRSLAGIKEILLVLLLLGGVAYFQRARILPWLEQYPQLASLMGSIRTILPQEPAKKGPVSVGGEARPAGGETTFSSGQGGGTVTPDDGSDSFRVVVPPEQEGAR